MAEAKGQEVADLEDRLARMAADADSARQDLIATVERQQVCAGGRQRLGPVAGLC